MVEIEDEVDVIVKGCEVVVGLMGIRWFVVLGSANSVVVDMITW